MGVVKKQLHLTTVNAFDFSNVTLSTSVQIKFPLFGAALSKRYINSSPTSLVEAQL